MQLLFEILSVATVTKWAPFCAVIIYSDNLTQL